MTLNIIKVTTQRAENNQKNHKKDNFYIISIKIVFIYLSWKFMSQPLLYIYLSFMPLPCNIALIYLSIRLYRV